MATSGFDTGRFARLVALIAFVTALFVLTAAETLEGQILQIGVFAIGIVSIITAMIGFLIAAGSAYETTTLGGGT